MVFGKLQTALAWHAGPSGLAAACLPGLHCGCAPSSRFCQTELPGMPKIPKCPSASVFTLPPRLAGALPRAALAGTYCCSKSQRALLLLQSLPPLLCFHSGFFHSTLHCLGTRTCLPPVGLSSGGTVPRSGDASCVFEDRANGPWQVPVSWWHTHIFAGSAPSRILGRLKSQE